ncbi:META domain-containing protein [Streptomyces sp. NPDC051183]|uniref:META domain-containing protein n=1 Tax=Streptomyces sp. NPDC051183 TaxID=3155165 RepID=UPI0034422284
MRTHRHVLAALALAAATTVTACSGHSPSGTSVPPTPAGHSWSVQSLTVDGRTLRAPAAAQLAIGDRQPYEATGNYGCNGFTAGVTFESDSAMTVKPGSTTAMACEDMAFETAFAGLFQGRLTIEAQPGRVTLSTAEGDSITMTTEPRTPDAPLTATTWIVNSLVSGGTAASLPVDAQGRARFTIAADGSASGSLGCNRFSAKATVDGTRLTFGPLVTTRMACEGAQGEVERALTELFGSNPLTWKIQGGTLTLTGPGPDAKGIVAEAASAAE